MQVKKFEAPTIQEALETIKRELGPEAIILQTKKNKRGFGLMSKESVEVTAAVSDRSLQKKGVAESRVPASTRDAIQKMPASRQAEFIDKAAARGVTAGRRGSGATAATTAAPSCCKSSRVSRTELRGVRRSWETMAANSCFMRSICLRWEMSWITR